MSERDQLYPRDYFETPRRIIGGTCFVIMPYRASHSAALYDCVKSAMNRNGMSCYRAVDSIRGGYVMRSVLEGLACSELILADVTGNNANVLYELGMAQTVRCEESIMLISQAVAEDAPFDIRDNRIIPYAIGDGLAALEATLTNRVHQMLPSRFVYRWSEDPEGKTSDPYGGEKPGLYRFRVCDVTPGYGGAEFRLLVFRHRKGIEDELVHKKDVYLESEGAPVKIEGLPSWSLRLHDASPAEAVFCACRPAQQPGQ